MTVSTAFDQRHSLARPDLAEQGLEGLVRATAYRPLTPLQGRVAVADIRAQADPASERLDQLLFGEVFEVLDRLGERVWGRARRDGVVGWMDRDDLGPPTPMPTHHVVSASAALPLNALIHHAWSGVAAEDLAPIGTFETDLAAVAERLLGTPHVLGARSSRATDCSGLVQQALYACGRPGPRFADQQALLGGAVDAIDARRGDLVVWGHARGDHAWTGHCAIMVDAIQVIHATGHHGAVVVEALSQAQARYHTDGFLPPVFRRLSL